MKLFILTILFKTFQSISFKKFVIDENWKQYKNEYSLEFKENEDFERKLIFMENLEYINEHNSKESSFKLEINQFSHLVFLIIIRPMKNTNPAKN